MARYDDAFTEAQFEQAQAALSFAKTLTLVPAESSVSLPDNMLEIFEGVDPCFLDTIYAAQGQDWLLYSDEFAFRQLAAEVGSVSGVWTQVAASQAQGEGIISADDYLEMLIGLI